MTKATHDLLARRRAFTHRLELGCGPGEPVTRALAVAAFHAEPDQRS
jgi:hypothetical protein